MSARGQSFRGRARGSTPRAPAASRGASRSRGSPRNSPTPSRGTFVARTLAQSTAPRPTRGSTSATSNGFSQRQTSPQAGASARAKTAGSWQERYQALTAARDKERADAIRRGLIADPEKPRSLSEAITPVGTCHEMCAEYERVQRVVQKDIWAEEVDPNHSAFALSKEEPDESRMVKKFRRSAAGLEEPLPSDLRPPTVLKRTCDYLFHDVIGNAETLAKVHHFVWDRTRAIRTDFSIQQVSRTEDLQIAVECYERIARFHILSLHELASAQRAYPEYDWQQERAQLDATLLSLMQYYDDVHGHFRTPNEAEFRAYCVIFQLQDRIPDLEDRVQTWPRSILKDQKVQKALDIYMAACNVLDQQGPMKQSASHLIARQDWQRFWNMIASKEVSFLMGCVAEIYFNLVRRTVLSALFRTSRANSSLKTPDWTVDVLVELLAFDNTDQVYDYCEKFGFSFGEREDGDAYLDLTSVKGRHLPEPAAGMAKQLKSGLVEDKRFGRTIPSVIDGVSVQQARNAGLVVEEEDHDVENARSHEAMMDGDRSQQDSKDMDDGDSLFMPQSNVARPEPASNSMAPASAPAAVSLFGGFSSGSTFGKPSAGNDSQSIFATPKPSISAAPGNGDTPAFNFTSPFAAASVAQASSSGFNFLGNNTKSSEATGEPSKSNSPFALGSTSTPAKISAFPSSTPAPAPAPGRSLLKFDGGSKSEDSKQAQFVASLPPDQPGPPTTSSAANPFGFPTPAAKSTLFQAPAAPVVASKPSTTFQLPASTAPAKQTGTSLFQTPSSNKEEAKPEWSAGAGLKAPPESTGRLQQEMTFSPLPEDLPVNAADSATAALKFASAPSEVVKAPQQQQPHPNPSVLSPTPVSGHHSTLGTYTPGIKRSSSASDNRPKKPSPLSNSITAADELAVDDSPHEYAVATSTHHVTPRDDYESHLTRVADEFLRAPVAGVLDQYLRWHVSHAIREVKEELESEQDNAIADEFRRRSLSYRYGKLWRSLFWQLKSVKSGRERRQRRQRRLQSRASVEQESPGAGEFSRSRSGSAFGGGIEPYNINVNMGSRWSKPATDESQTSAGSKRPLSSHGHNISGWGKTAGHKRMKSTSHIDSRGRVAKPTAATNQSGNDLLKRSTFLTFSADKQEAPIKNTTTSSYFRLKAMGLHRIDNVAGPRGTKRRLSDSMQNPTQTSPPAVRTPLLRSPSQDPSAGKARMPPPTSAPSRASQRSDEDEALLARLRAAREHLTQSTAYYKDEISRDEEMRKSLTTSQSSNEYDSPSMALARYHARSRLANHASADQDVPAYRLRESRFVPREHYGRAIERAKENIEARSRASSRPESRSDVHQFDKTFSRPDLGMSFPAPTQTQDPVILNPVFPPKTNGFGSHLASQIQPQSQSSWPPPGGLPASQSEKPLKPIDFANHTTQIPGGNPFLTDMATENSSSNVQSAITPRSPLKQADSTAFNQTIQPSQSNLTPLLPPKQSTPPIFNQTIQPSQINQALANSFGESHGHGQNHMFSIAEQSQRLGQQNSHTENQSVNLLSDEEEEEEQHTYLYPAPSHTNGDARFEDEMAETEEENTFDNNHTYATESEDGSEEEDLHQTFGHNNTYAALAHTGDTEDEDEVQWDSEEADEEGYDSDKGDYEEYDEQNVYDGDTEEDDETQDASGEDYDRTDQFDEGPKVERSPAWARRPRRTPSPAPNMALHAAGNNADEPLELSD